MPAIERSGAEDESGQLPEEAPPEQVADDDSGRHGDESGDSGDKGDSDAGQATGNPRNAG